MVSSNLSTRNFFWLLACGSLLVFCSLVGCQKKPTLGSAADPLAESEPPPMGATVYNDELKHELTLLDKVLDHTIDQKKLEQLKKALMSGEMSALSKDGEDKMLVNLLLTLPELIHEQNFSDNRQQWLRGKLFFLRRRFIEASKLMTAVLANEPNFHEARNWRARAIFFLGNPDMAIKELTVITTKAGEKSPQGLDALYLIGAIVFESNELDKPRLTTGINAWTRYLELAKPTEQLSKEVTEGLAELALRKEGKHAQNSENSLDPFSPRDTYSSEKNAILRAFAKEELLLAKELCEYALKASFDPEIATIKARILFKTGQLDEALALFTEITNKNDRYAPGFHYRGMAYMMQGKPKEAVQSWKLAQKANATYAKAFKLDERIAVAEKLIEPQKIETH